MTTPSTSNSTSCTLDHAAHLDECRPYVAATDPEAVDWRAAFARRHEQAEDRERQLAARIAELEAATDPLAAVTDAAKKLAELTGEGCNVQCCAWYHPGAVPSVNAQWMAYRVGQRGACYLAATCDEATDQVRADWAADRIETEDRLKAEQDAERRRAATRARDADDRLAIQVAERRRAFAADIAAASEADNTQAARLNERDAASRLTYPTADDRLAIIEAFVGAERSETEARLAREAVLSARLKAVAEEAGWDARIKAETLRPDREKLLAVAAAVEAIPVPEVSPASAATADKIRGRLADAAADIRFVVTSDMG